MVSTLDFESSDPSPNLGGTLHFWLEHLLDKFRLDQPCLATSLGLETGQNDPSRQVQSFLDLADTF